MTTKTELKLEEVAERTDVSARTVRYYVQRGLLPPPVFRGKDSAYGEEHVVRLKAVKTLQAAFFPLDAIKVVLDSASPHELERIAKGHVPARAIAEHVDASPMVPQPPPHVRRAHAGVRVEKIELMPGVELLVEESASPAAKKFVAMMLEQAKKEGT